ncbi:permease YjgP/YjgQ family protein [Gemmatirosa kalamazoonensis]|uniref:Permease YjgP/YjgQ family protein n=1 Tax=Gemmatirosa kalamazoonensis TaxID=861299 RepID=W0RN24_9BACT|nr:LptF/LptG family permease [Gemmatirosa kalamazoonensis]AHG91700.1 permease YjgP/YjgQ family protein [Gemmatirosa kalamazoonensis]
MARTRFRVGHALDRYVLSEFTKIFVVTAIGFPILVFIIDLVDNLNKYLSRNIPKGDLVLSYVYWLPDTMFNVLPAAVLFATVFTIGAVTRHSEITAAKASGISFYRFIAPIFVGASFAMLIGLAIGEIAPRLNARRLALIKETRSSEGNVRTRFAYAGENGRVYKAAQLVVDSGSMIVVEIERKGTGPDYPSHLIAASNAKWRPARGWTLGKGTFHVLPTDSLDLAFAFDSLVDRQMRERPRDLMLTPKAPEDMDYAELGRFIAAQARSGADVNALRVSRMLKITIPVTCVIILLFGAPLATSTQRGGAAFGVGLSLGTTVIFLVLIQLTRAIGGKGLVVPEVAAWIPSAIFGFTGLILLARTRT